MKLTAAAVMAAASIAVAAPTASAGKIGPNHAPYWGDDCVKVDHGVGNDGATLDVNRAYRLVVLKSARSHDTFYDVRPGDRLTTVSGNGISHYILCTAVEVPPTTTVAPSTTTTRPFVLASTTSTTPPSTTTSVVPSATTTTLSTPTSTTLPTTSVLPSTTSTMPADLVVVTATTVPSPSSLPEPPTALDSASDERDLAFTGTDVSGLLVLAIGLLGLGMAMVLVGRRDAPIVVEHSDRGTD